MTIPYGNVRDIHLAISEHIVFSSSEHPAKNWLLLLVIQFKARIARNLREFDTYSFPPSLLTFAPSERALFFCCAFA